MDCRGVESLVISLLYETQNYNAIFSFVYEEGPLRKAFNERKYVFLVIKTDVNLPFSFYFDVIKPNFVLLYFSLTINYDFISKSSGYKIYVRNLLHQG